MGFPINPPNSPIGKTSKGEPIYLEGEWYRFLLNIQKLIGGPVSPFDDSALLATGNSGLVASKQDGDPTLDALSDLDATPGLLTQTGADTFTKRTLQAPAAGLTITHPAGTAGDPTFVLANDLAALEALSGTDTIYYRSGVSTWTAVTIGASLGFSAGTLSRAALTGDVTASADSNATTLATVNANVGTFGSATQSVQVTFNAKGLATAAANVTITPAVGSVTGLGTGVATALGVNVGSAGAFVTFNGALGTPSSGTLTNATGLPTAGLVDAAVTYAKMQDVSAGSKLLGRGDSGSGDVQEITLGANLTMTGTTLAASGGGGSAAGNYETLDIDSTDGGNVTTTETDLFTKTLDAGELGVDGDRIEARWGGTYVGHATATRQLRAYFGGTLILDTGALTVSTTSSWSVHATITRVSASVVRCDVVASADNVTFAAPATYTEITGLTLANTQIVKLTGTAAGVGAASDDIIGKTASVEKRPVTPGVASDGDYGDITISGSGTVMTVDNDAVTYAKMQNVSATDRLLGRDTAGAGNVEEISLGVGLAMSSTTLSAGAWTLVDQSGVATAGQTWAWSTNVTEVDVTGLGSYNELLIFAVGVSTAVGGNVRGIRVSVDNGTSFYTGASDYTDVPISGSTSGTSAFMNHGTTSVAARSVVGHIKNLKGPVKQAIFMAGTTRYFTASTSDINAIRLNDSAGVNMTAGTLYVFVR